MDFDSASRRLAQEQKARREAAKRRRESEALAARRVEAQAEAARKLSAKRKEEAIVRERREADRERRQAFMTGGILWSANLRAVPIVADGDRVELPASALPALEGAIEPGRPLAFELRISGTVVVEEVEDEDGYSFAPDATHAGVSSFSANEGEIGLPPKTMLSLAKNGETAAALESGEALVSVRYLRLPAVPESTATLRPLSDGFFSRDEDDIDIDLKSVLESELGRHTALTQGDLLALDVDGRTVRLRVESLEPHRALCVLNTDLTVDLMPSEKVRAKEIVESLRRDRRQAIAVVRQARAAAVRTFSSPSSSPLRVLLRYRDGSRAEQKFDRSDSASRLADFVDARLGDRLDPDVADWMLVATHPKRIVSRKDLVDSLTIVEAVGDNAVAFLVEPSNAEDEVVSAKADIFEESELWDRARKFADAETERQTKRLVEEKEAEPASIAAAKRDFVATAEMTGADRAVLFNELVHAGLERQEAADAAQRFGAQLAELDSMGMLRQNPRLALNFLKRYDGRMLRVVNALSDAIISAPQEESATEHQKPPSTTLPRKSQTQSLAVVDPQKVLFPAIFQRLVANGASPNDAAARAILLAANPRSLTLLSEHSGHVDNAVTAILLLS